MIIVIIAVAVLVNLPLAPKMLNWGINHWCQEKLTSDETAMEKSAMINPQIDA